jgi:HK97 family phage major capsid protein
MLNRAYSLVTVKGFDPEKRTFTGIATSPVADRTGDTIDSKGVKFKNPLPLLLYHDTKKPVGEVRFGKASTDGTPFSALISTIDRDGVVKDRLDEAVDSLNAKPPLIRAVSIGFRPTKDPEYNQATGGFHFSEIEVLELSMVVVPAHQDATIDLVKSLDTGCPASGATATSHAHTLPGASGLSRVKLMRTETRTMRKSITEQIKEWEATRAAKSARMDELVTKGAETGETMDEAEAQEHDGLEVEVKSIDAQLVRLRAAEQRAKETAVVVKGDEPVQGGLVVKPGTRIQVTRELPKGLLFARYALCMAGSRGIPGEAMRLAKEHYKDDPGVLAMVQKTAVAGGSTSGSHYLDDMVPYNVMQDFIEYLRPGSIIGKFGGPNPGGGPNYPSLNRVGFNERVSGMSTGYTAGWKGEGLPALPSAAVTFNQSLTWNCMSALAVLTKEAIRFSNPSAEEKVRAELARAVNAKLDIDFIDPAKAASGTTSPASITNGVVATTPTGTTAAYFRTNLATMLKLFTANNLGTGGLVLIMSESQAVDLSMMINTLGNEDFPMINSLGGSIRGIPVITSEYLTTLGSPALNSIVAVKANEVYLADDGVVTVEASDQASVEMVDTSSQSALSGTGASQVSLWQTGAVGLLANREITWKLRRSTAVQYISPAAYVA